MTTASSTVGYNLGLDPYYEVLFRTDGSDSLTPWRQLFPIVTLHSGSFIETDTNAYTFVPEA